MEIGNINVNINTISGGDNNVDLKTSNGEFESQICIKNIFFLFKKLLKLLYF